MKTSFILMLSLGLAVLAGAVHAESTPAKKLPKKIKVFLLAGQSNMEGKGDGSKLTAEDRDRLAKAQPQVRFAYNRQPIKPLDVTDAGEGNKKRFGIDYSFGPELFFGLCLAEAWPDEQILLIKRSVGATSLYGRWNPDWTKEKAALMGEDKAQPLYPDFIAYMKEVLSSYKKDEYEFCGMLWVQGEADSNVSQRGPVPAESYGATVRNLIHHVRRETGVPDLPFVMLGVGGGKVTEGMVETSKTVKNVSYVPRSMDTSSPNFYPQHAVGHYNYEGQKRIGSLMAAAYLQNYNSRTRPATVLSPLQTVPQR